MKNYTLAESIEISNRVTHATSALITAAVTLVIGTVLFKVLWSWTVPELFPGAVVQGLILGEITWLTALKITGLFAILTSASSLIAGQWQR
ncbi:MAG: hypothetical protein JSV69_11020 [Chloroflexota bacterium]|nr:MAG: hypothetical protein JSV69_11020 [Chloroflexota bacterium]